MRRTHPRLPLASVLALVTALVRRDNAHVKLLLAVGCLALVACGADTLTPSAVLPAGLGVGIAGLPR